MADYQPNPLNMSPVLDDALNQMADELIQIRINALKKLEEGAHNAHLELSSFHHSRRNAFNLQEYLDVATAARWASTYLDTLTGRQPGIALQFHSDAHHLQILTALLDDPEKRLKPVQHVLERIFSVHKQELNAIRDRLIKEKNAHLKPKGCNPLSKLMEALGRNSGRER